MHIFFHLFSAEDDIYYNPRLRSGTVDVDYNLTKISGTVHVDYNPKQSSGTQGDKPVNREKPFVYDC